MFHLIRNSVAFPVNQPPNAKPAWDLLTPNKAGYVALVNQMFSIFLFLVLYSLSYKGFLPSTPLCSSLNGDCPLHEVFNKVCLYYLLFVNYFLTPVRGSRIYHLKMCHFGMWIIWNCHQSRPSRLRKSFLPLQILILTEFRKGVCTRERAITRGNVFIQETYLHSRANIVYKTFALLILL